jgi:hypothetical protein
MLPFDQPKVNRPTRDTPEPCRRRFEENFRAGGNLDHSPQKKQWRKNAIAVIQIRNSPEAIFPSHMGTTTSSPRSRK